MHILSIKTAYPYQDEINKIFEKLGHSLSIIDEPPSPDEDSTLYLQQLLSKTREYHPNFLFSLGFYPFISLACGALGIPYVCWLIDGFDPAYYASPILNEWNHVFAVDSQLAKELSDLGVKHISFLPFGTSTEMVEPLSSGKLTWEKYSADLSLIGTSIPRASFDTDILHADSPLPDASKGYLEGCLACQTQLRTLPSICSTSLPDTVWTDLQATFPATDIEDCENPRSYYEHRYFNPMISQLERGQYLEHAASLPCITTMHHYGASAEGQIGKLNRYLAADWYHEIPIIAQASKINLNLAHRDYKAAIPPVAWAILGSGGFLLSSTQGDFSILDTKPIRFSNPNDFRKKVTYYMEHEEERCALAEALHREVQAKHTLTHRITELLKKV